MSDESDRLHTAYNEARTRWFATEREYHLAGLAFEVAAQERKAAWDKLVAAAAALPDDVTRKVVNEQFGLCEDEGCPHAGTPHVCIQKKRDGVV